VGGWKTNSNNGFDVTKKIKTKKFINGDFLIFVFKVKNIAIFCKKINLKITKLT
jgi:hypothetical protein